MADATEALAPLVTSVAACADVIQEALVAIRNHLGMEVAYFSEFVDGRAIFRRVDAPGLEHLIKVDDSHSLDDVYCNHILEGRLPELMPDTSQVDLARAMPITAAVPIGAHVSIPVRLADGTPFGMFCCLSPRPNPSLNERDLATMRVFANIATKQVNADLLQLRVFRQTQSAIAGMISAASFEIAFQPIVELQSGSITGCEALCRFQSTPFRSPDKWFADAASVGLGVELELAVLATTMTAFQRLPEPISLSVNASPNAVLTGRLAELIPPAFANRTIVEITEHAAVPSYADLHARLAPLKAAGVRIAVDDAGAGYSGLQHIVQLAPDIIKMDMSLTRAIDSDPARRALASAMVFYARETGARVTAEGIETNAELNTLRMLGANTGQGYLLGRPGPISAMTSAYSDRDIVAA